MERGTGYKMSDMVTAGRQAVDVVSAVFAGHTGWAPEVVAAMTAVAFRELLDNQYEDDLPDSKGA
jgi:hypothetical protein